MLVLSSAASLDSGALCDKILCACGTLIFPCLCKIDEIPRLHSVNLGANWLSKLIMGSVCWKWGQ